MNVRLQQFISAENLSQSQFADIIGVARASVSHIIAGRNKPGFDFIESITKHFPNLNVEWLITGKGRMYKSDAHIGTPAAAVVEKKDPENFGNLFSTVIQSPGPAAEQIKEEYAQRAEKQHDRTREIKPLLSRSISRIVIFYDDNTYQELK